VLLRARLRNLLENYLMKSFKVEHFVRANDGLHFPWFISLQPSELTCLQRRLFHTLNLPEDASLSDLVSSIAKKERLWSGGDAEDDEFDLASVLNAIGITPSDFVYLNWYRFDEIDQMKFVDLVKYFDDIWYPSSDDIDIFDESLSWMVSISHEGRVYGQIIESPGA
jgi:hypothetical protein